MAHAAQAEQPVGWLCESCDAALSDERSACAIGCDWAGSEAALSLAAMPGIASPWRAIVAFIIARWMACMPCMAVAALSGAWAAAGGIADAGNPGAQCMRSAAMACNGTDTHNSHSTRSLRQRFMLRSLASPARRSQMDVHRMRVHG